MKAAAMCALLVSSALIGFDVGEYADDRRVSGKFCVDKFYADKFYVDKRYDLDNVVLESVGLMVRLIRSDQVKELS
ncbi:MAG: hypothetical protein L0I22_01435 [Lactobacillus sp.]|nr:hypothetical protein [Lactobacillus sp.]